jgi:hypothetical protein
MKPFLAILIVVVGVLAVLALLQKKPESLSPEAQFWNWVKAEESRLFDFRQDQARVFQLLSYELRKLNPDLTFQFGPLVDGKRELAISADGIKAIFPAVLKLTACAPRFETLKITAFRPRISPAFTTELEGKALLPQQVYIGMGQDGEYIALRVAVLGHEATDETLLKRLVYLMLDGVLGEWDMETKVGGIFIVKVDAIPDLHSSLLDVPAEFDSLWRRLFGDVQPRVKGMTPMTATA